MQTEPDHASSEVIRAVQAWVRKAVIGLNLCPFAKAVDVKNQIRYVVSQASTVDELRNDLSEQLRFLQHADPEQIDTILLIHPFVLQDFYDYNDFLDVADAALDDLELSGEIQIASFHPDYQFADAASDDITNCTNRAPYPILHLLRESSMDRAVAAFPEADEIFERNMETMRSLGHSGWAALMDEVKGRSSSK